MVQTWPILIFLTSPYTNQDKLGCVALGEALQSRNSTKRFSVGDG